MMAYDMAKMRAKLKTQMGKMLDPNEFKAPKCQGVEIKYRFYILEPLSEGEPCVGGYASRDMDTFSVPYGVHWINNRPHVCPRVLSEQQEECPMCSTGFELLSESKANNSTKEQQRLITRQWLANNTPMVNIYFPPHKSNPLDLQDKVMYFKAPGSMASQWKACAEREDAGDPEEPEAFGAFFDMRWAYLYEMRITKSGDWNEYKTSTFLANLGPRPIVALSDGTPDEKAIEAIAARRHDLWLKAGNANVPELKRLMAKMVDGDDGDSGFDEDETAAPAKASNGNGHGRPGNGKPVSNGRTESAVAATAVLEEEEEVVTPAASTRQPAKPGPAPQPKSNPLAAPAARAAATAVAARASAPAARAAAPAARAVTPPTKAPVVVADDGDDDDIDSLLSQLPTDD